jgi:ABC-type branched-subunit amino acid transport system permease subunit
MMEGDVEGDPQMDLDFNDANALGGADNTTWDSLPIFATPAHHSLFAQIQLEKSRVAQLSEAVQENEERIAIMGEHLKNVQQELQHTQV